MNMDIGHRIRNLRRLKQLTQEELAERTNLSKGYISQIEHANASPNMETFLNILEVLGTPPAEFFKVPTEEKVLYKKEAQVVYDEYDEGYVLNWLVNRSNEFDMEPLIVHIKPGAAYKNFKPSADSDTFVYCLQGGITLTLGERRYVAETGDALYFKANDIHQLSNHTDTMSDVLIVATASYL